MVTWKRSFIEVADYHSIPSIIVEETPMRKKQGLSGYHVECYKWYGEMRYQVCLDCSWWVDCFPTFDTLRDAWAYITKYTKPKEPTADA